MAPLIATHSHLHSFSFLLTHLLFRTNSNKAHESPNMSSKFLGLYLQQSLSPSPSLPSLFFFCHSFSFPHSLFLLLRPFALLPSFPHRLEQKERKKRQKIPNVVLPPSRCL
ncbi:hypothetical protein F5H01DRAFT_335562 [Linnemannia elongata]|nr:hypothetical protein F5H01DRAFT_335562 [Linnemannia elongata]